MITFIVTYDLAYTQSRPNENEKFKKIISTAFNASSLQGQAFKRNAGIESARFQEGNYDLPNTTFLINAHNEKLNSKKISEYIFDLIKDTDIVIGKLYIGVISTNDVSHIPYVI